MPASVGRSLAILFSGLSLAGCGLLPNPVPISMHTIAPATSGGAIALADGVASLESPTICFDPDDVRPVTEFAEGKKLISGAIEFEVLDYPFMGSPVHHPLVEVLESENAGGQPLELGVNRATLAFDAAKGVRRVRFLIGHYGPFGAAASPLIHVNGHALNLSGLKHLRGTWWDPTVDASILVDARAASLPASHPSFGFADLISEVNIWGNVDDVSIGGAEIFLDDFCIGVEPPEGEATVVTRVLGSLPSEFPRNPTADRWVGTWGVPLEVVGKGGRTLRQVSLHDIDTTGASNPVPMHFVVYDEFTGIELARQTKHLPPGAPLANWFGDFNLDLEAGQAYFVAVFLDPAPGDEVRTRFYSAPSTFSTDYDATLTFRIGLPRNETGDGHPAPFFGGDRTRFPRLQLRTSDR